MNNYKQSAIIQMAKSIVRFFFVFLKIVLREMLLKLEASLLVCVSYISFPLCIVFYGVIHKKGGGWGANV